MTAVRATIVCILLGCICATGARAQGQSLVLDINPGAASSSISTLKSGRTDFGAAVVYFTAIDGSGVRKLWRSGGTPDSTYSLSELAVYQFFAPSVGGVYFTASTPDRGSEPFRSDGVNAALPLPEVVAGPADGALGFSQRAYEGRPAFRAERKFLKVTDAGYAEIAQFIPSLASIGETMGIVGGPSAQQPVFAFGAQLGSGRYLPYDPGNLTTTQGPPHVLGSTANVLCGKAYSITSAGGEQPVLYCARPAAGTFAQVVPPESGALVRLPDNTTFAPFAGLLAFSGISTSAGLWVTDGSNAGTYRLSEVIPNFFPCLAGAGASRLLFVRGGNIWIADAAPLSARELMVLPPFQGAALECQQIDSGTAIAPTATWRGATFVPIAQGRLFATDGTTENSRILLSAASVGAAANELAFADSQLIYAGTASGSGTELWTLPPILLFDDSFD